MKFSDAIIPNEPPQPKEPHLRGSYYGPHEGIFPLPGWNLISIPEKEVDEPWYIDSKIPHYGKFTP